MGEKIPFVFPSPVVKLARRLVVKKMSVLFLAFAIGISFSGCKKKEEVKTLKGGGVKVVMVKPTGKLTTENLEAVQIAVKFSQPIVPFSAISSNVKGERYLEIKPFVKGKYYWKGIDLLVFEPEKGFTPSTEYTVKVKKGIESLSHKNLEEDYRWEFITPTPLPVKLKSNFDSHYRHLYRRKGYFEVYGNFAVNSKFFLRFNQDIEIKAAKGRIYLMDKSGRKTGTELGYGKDEKGNALRNVLVLKPERELNFSWIYNLVLEPGLLGIGGNYPSKEKLRIKIKTQERFKISRFSRKIFADSDPYIKFTTPVSSDELYSKIKIYRKKGRELVPIEIKKPEYKSEIRYFSPHLPVEQNSIFVIEIPENLENTYGQKFGKNKRLNIKKCQIHPYFATLNNISLLPSDTDKVPYYSFSTEEINARAFSFKLPVFRGLILSLDSINLYNINKKILPGSPFKDYHVKVPPESREKYKGYIDVKGPGAYLLNFRLLDYDPCGLLLNKKEEFSSLVYLSDIAFTFKLSPLNSYIFASNMNTGDPESDVKFYIAKRGKVLWSGKTNENGEVTAPGRDALVRHSDFQWAPFILFAEKDGNPAFLETSYAYSIADPWDYGIYPGYEAETYRVYLFTEKDIYRRGDKVRLGGIVRKVEDGKVLLPEQKSVWIEVESPTGKQLKKEKINLNSLGGFSYEYKIGEKADYGSYSLVLIVNYKKFYKNFRVEYYVPNKFQAKVNLIKKRFVRDESFKAEVYGFYLFGAPMAGDRLHYTLRLTESSFSPRSKKLRDYFFGNVLKEERNSEVISQEDVRFNENGHTSLSILLNPKEIKGFSEIYLEATAIAKDESEYTAKAYGEYFPSKLLVGVRGEYFFKAGEKFPLKLVVINTEEKPVSANVKVKLLKRKWKYEKDQWKKEDRKLKEERIKIDGRGEYILSVSSPGYYIISFEVEDSKGRKFVSSRGFYAYSEEPYWEEGEKKVEIEAEKDNFSPKERAKFLIISPYKEAKALVTVERGKILEKKLINLKGRINVFELNIKDDYVPNVFISATVYGKENGLYAKATTAYKAIFVDTAKKKLDVKIQPEKKEAKPGETIRVRVKTKDWKGNPAKARLFLFAVDEGVLSLTSYKTPNPFLAFYREYPLLFETYDSRKSFYDIYAWEDKLKKGKGAGGGGISYRSKFLEVVFWKEIETDENGVAEAEIKFADSLTTYRIMAVAYEDDKFGSDDTRIVVTKKLLLKRAIPEFLIEGDKIQAGVLVSNRTERPLRGAVYAKGEGIKIYEDEKELEIGAGKTEFVAFTIEGEKEGKATLYFSAEFDGEKDGIKLQIPVLSRMMKVKNLQFFSGKDIEIPVKKPEGRAQELETIISPAVLKLQGPILKKLYFYPYECLEQKASRLLPFLAIGKTIKRYGVSKVNEADIERSVEKFVSSLPDYACYSGGLWYYKDKRRCSPYLTSYILWLLKFAEKRGYYVDERFVENMMDYLNREKGKFYPDAKAFTSYVLALWGEKDDSFLNSMLTEKDLLTPSSLSFLMASAYLHGRGKYSRDINSIGRKLSNSLVLEGDFAYFVSPSVSYLRDMPFLSNYYATAVSLWALLKFYPRFKDGDKVVRWLLEKKKGIFWETTQENLWLLLALSEYAGKYERERGAKGNLQIAGQSFKFNLSRGRAEKFKKKFKLFSFPENFNISLKANSRVYLSSVLGYENEIKSPILNGIFVERLVLDKHGNPVKEFKKGELYQVILNIKNTKDMPFVVIDEPVPSGFTVLREDFTTSRGMKSFIEEKFYPFTTKVYGRDKITFYSSYLHEGDFTITYFLKATFRGKMAWLPAKAAAMYHPEYMGTEVLKHIEIK